MKIHLIGGSGTGKSFIARHLAAQFDIPTLDLDDIFWDRDSPRYGVRAPSDQRDAALTDFVKRDNWIVEGVYYRWVLPSFERADLRFALVPQLWKRQSRIICRFIRRKLGVETGSRESVRSLWQLLAWNRGYDEDNLARALALLDSCSLKVTRCESLQDVFRHLNQFGEGTTAVSAED